VPRPLIFSDLDGTFLDEAYSPVLTGAEASRVFARYVVVWVSSRTADELLEVQRRIGHGGDAIGENGGVLVSHDREFARALGSPEPLGDAWVVTLAAPRDETAALVRRAFDRAGAAARTLDGIGVGDLARRSGYALRDAERALQRRTSVLLVDADPAEPKTAAALGALRRQGASVAHGGRWISVVQGSDKGSAIRAWVAAWRERDRAAPALVAGIGDADNDEPLLRAVGLPFVVRRPHRGHAPTLAAIEGARLLEREGTTGWLEMLEYLDAVAGDQR
jgi:mannosyl-3-phosphoglycerate phosphatase